VRIPNALVTYVNYPTTEYLALPFLDLVCFNVYLESQNSWERIPCATAESGAERPLILSEIGLDSRRNGEERQAQSLDWLIRTASPVVAQEYLYSGGQTNGIEAASILRIGTLASRGGIGQKKSRWRLFTECLPRLRSAPHGNWPSITVVVCSYNGHRTLGECLDGISKLRYRNFEVILVDDGSSPPLEPIVAPYGFRIIRTPNKV